MIWLPIAMLCRKGVRVCITELGKVWCGDMKSQQEVEPKILDRMTRFIECAIKSEAEMLLGRISPSH